MALRAGKPVRVDLGREPFIHRHQNPAILGADALIAVQVAEAGQGRSAARNRPPRLRHQPFGRGTDALDRARIRFQKRGQIVGGQPEGRAVFLHIGAGRRLIQPAAEGVGVIRRRGRDDQCPAVALAKPRENGVFKAVALLAFPCRAFVHQRQRRRPAEDRLAVSRDAARQAAAVAGIFDLQLAAAPDQELFPFIPGQPLDEADQKLKRRLGLIAVPGGKQNLAPGLIVPHALQRPQRQPGRERRLGIAATDRQAGHHHAIGQCAAHELLLEPGKLQRCAGHFPLWNFQGFQKGNRQIGLFRHRERERNTPPPVLPPFGFPGIGTRFAHPLHPGHSRTRRWRAQMRAAATDRPCLTSVGPRAS